MNNLNLDLKKKFNNALASSSKAVVYHNSGLKKRLSELAESRQEHYLLGIKNTSQISKKLVDKLTEDQTFLLHTIDKMARGGRAVDPELINPLTLRVMTGSSSGGCLNILRGINDLAVGTDGGGSVLAPAASVSLSSLMAKGMGLQATNKRISTDNLEFRPGIGFISHDFKLCTLALKKILAPEQWALSKDVELNKDLTIALPEVKSVLLPQGEDMAAVTAEIEAELSDFNLNRINLKGSEDRKQAIQIIEKAFEQGNEIIITAEGPVDYYGYGDSVAGSFKIAEAAQKKSGKYLMRAANLVNATAVTIPTDRLGLAIVLLARPGIKNGFKVIKLAERLQKCYKRPELFARYFLKNYAEKENDFLGADNFDQYFE
ncbi:amidase [Halanaerobium saccharolyticum]|uniref:Amidase n=1 Tax=Halanaerobium saccharolyticum TaxID=43595 RepID=A0A4R7ZCL2_9FIRM|nr:amidase family protein [Halanaerobium saccharolyticum]RAK12475.1 amidase [Halanaerobium saccharolyticum]TDW06401.1 amidase [Halanaerobium saccharolyticum]TDX61649.1 amidase [Halanaerobium saccharolyticum]